MGNKKLGVIGIFLFLIIGFIFIINSSVVKNVSGDLTLIVRCDPSCGPHSTCISTSRGNICRCDEGYEDNNGGVSIGGEGTDADGCETQITSSCDDGMTYCSPSSYFDGGCVNLQTNEECCGACYHYCEQGETCCEGICRNGYYDDEYCGNEGLSCDDLENCTALNKVCYQGSCETPDCDNKECGSDGFGGSCGTCGTGEVCSNGQCHNAICEVSEGPHDDSFNKVMGLSELSNAHGELASEDNYNYGLYCNFPGDNSSGRLMYLSSSTNAHAGNPSWTSSDNYDVPVYYSGFYSCRGNTGSCGSNEIEVPVPLYSTHANSHINVGSVKICCTLNIKNTLSGGYCGDGNLDAGEECDDGNIVSGDGCSSECKNETEGPNAYWAENTILERPITQKGFSFEQLPTNNAKVKLIIENETGSGSIDLLVSETNGLKGDATDLIISADYTSKKYVGTWTIKDGDLMKFKAYSGPYNFTFTSQENFPGLTSSPFNLTVTTFTPTKYCSSYTSEDTCNNYNPQSVADRSVPVSEADCSAEDTGCFCWWNGSSCEYGWSKLPPNCLTNPNAECWLTGNGSLCLDNCTCSNGKPDGVGYCEGGVACNQSKGDECWIAGDLCNGTDCTCMGDTNKSEVIPGTCSFDIKSASLGNCTYVQFGDDTCEDDNQLTYNWTATWTWNSKNIFENLTECTKIIGKEDYCVLGVRDNKYHYDPFNKNLECKKGGTTVPCPAQIQLGFFDNWNFLTVIVLIFVIYYLWSSKKKKSSKKKSKK